MNLTEKLRLIQEGYSFDDINTGNISPFQTIQESTDGLSLFTESIITDINYMTEMSVDLIHENSGVFEHIKKFFEWIKQKIKQFVDFLRGKYSKNDIYTTELDNKIKSDIDRLKLSIKTPEFKLKVEQNLKLSKDIEVPSNIIGNKSMNFAELGLGKIFDVLSARMRALITKPVEEHKPASDDEKVFLDDLFNEAFGITYSRENIIKKVYGENKKLTVNYTALITYGSDLDAMQHQQKEIAEMVEKEIPDRFRTYESSINIHIARAKDNINSIKNPEIIDHETKIVEKMNADYISKQNKAIEDDKFMLQEISKLSKYFFKLSNEFLAIHKQITDKFRSDLSSMLNKATGDEK